MHPVLGGLPDKILLSASSRCVAFCWAAPRADEVIEPRQLNNKSIIVIFPKGFRTESGCENGLEVPRGCFLVCVRGSSLGYAGQALHRAS